MAHVEYSTALAAHLELRDARCRCQIPDTHKEFYATKKNAPRVDMKDDKYDLHIPDRLHPDTTRRTISATCSETTTCIYEGKHWKNAATAMHTTHGRCGKREAD
ncbi:hypothetical protein PINS_up009775 [Pythium insidiosum]|nr:hypothetical protein PINS_up009775 [Pythium insidiosum]